MASTYPLVRNLGFFASFMQAYGRADAAARAELYRDTSAYQYGAEPAILLYQQVTQLLGVPVPV
jgi:hypothetical protein